MPTTKPLTHPMHNGLMPTILKQNEYKCVTLHRDEAGNNFVSKAYSAQGAEQDRKNTEYIARALEFFHREFSAILTAPRLLATNLDKCEIAMEFLPKLPQAKRLSLKTLPLAQPFFEKCYSVRDDRGFLRTVNDSVIATPAVHRLLATDFPLALGFKSDLKENLCLARDELILADIDSIALEPLGLSELVLYAEMFASSRLHPALRSMIIRPSTPVAFEHLTSAQAHDLIEAVQEVIALLMTNLSAPLQRIKLRISRHFLEKLAQCNVHG